jgi:hypothetical protein
MEEEMHMGEEVGKEEVKMEGEKDMKMIWFERPFPWGHVKIQGTPHRCVSYPWVFQLKH